MRLGKLVSNAVRHNFPDGRVTVDTRARNGRAVLTVTNTDPKVPPAELARLFLPFERLDPERTSGANGLGLGLSIVDAIAQAHAAAIRSRAVPEGGLEVEVDFPAAV